MAALDVCCTHLIVGAGVEKLTGKVCFFCAGNGAMKKGCAE
jgi:hypothetical protein